MLPPVFAHTPRQKWGNVLWRCSSLAGAGSQVFLQPMTRAELPEFNGLKQGKHHGGQFRTPDTAGAVVVFAACNGIADRLFRRIIVHGDFRMSHKNDEALPVIAQAGQHLTLCPRQLLKPVRWDCLSVRCGRRRLYRGSGRTGGGLVSL